MARARHAKEREQGLFLAIQVFTPYEVVRKMLELAKVSAKDVVCDLGCGDARIVVMAVKEFGAKKAIGYEISEDLYKASKREIERQNLQNKITLIRANLLDADLSEASVITLYLSTTGNELLRPKLEKESKPGTRIVSYCFPIDAWRATTKIDRGTHLYSQSHFAGALYLYTSPKAFRRGTWATMLWHGRWILKRIRGLVRLQYQPVLKLSTLLLLFWPVTGQHANRARLSTPSPLSPSP